MNNLQFCQCIVDWTDETGICTECNLPRTTFYSPIALQAVEEETTPAPRSLEEQLAELGALGYISASALRGGEAIRSADQEITRAFEAGDEIQKVQLGAWLNAAVVRYNTLCSLHVKAMQPDLMARLEQERLAQAQPRRAGGRPAAKLSDADLDAMFA